MSATVGTAWNQRTCKHLTESSGKFQATPCNRYLLSTFQNPTKTPTDYAANVHAEYKCKVLPQLFKFNSIFKAKAWCLTS